MSLRSGKSKWGNSFSQWEMSAKHRTNLFFPQCVLLGSCLGCYFFFFLCNDRRSTQQNNLWLGRIGQLRTRWSKTRFIVKCARNGAFTVQHTCLNSSEWVAPSEKKRKCSSGLVSGGSSSGCWMEVWVLPVAEAWNLFIPKPNYCRVSPPRICIPRIEDLCVFLCLKSAETNVRAV